MTEKFNYLVERLHQAGKRMDCCQNKEERKHAQRWLVLWNRAIRLEFERRGTNNTPQ